MENCNIQLYKDGNDIIVVFKNPSSDIKDIVNNILFSITNRDVDTKVVPAVEPLPEVELAVPEVDKYEKLVPEFLNDDCGNELSQIELDNPVLDDVEETKQENHETENDVTANNVFVSGKYMNMSPAQIVEKDGNIGFYILCSTYAKGIFRTPELKQDTINTIKDYLSLHDKELGDIRSVKSDGLKQILIACYNACKKIIDEEVAVADVSDFETYLEKSTEFQLRGLCWKCINEIRKFVKTV